MTLRMRLFFLVMAGIIPVLATQAYNQAALRHERRAEAQRSVQLEAKMVASEIEQIASGMHKFLLAVANSAQVRPEATGCNAYLTKLNDQFPGSLSIGVSDARGEVYCYAKPFLPGTLNNADRLHFKLALAGDQFAIGDMMVGKETGKNALGFAYPLPHDPQGQPQGVVFASLSVDWLGDHLARNPLSPGHTLTVVDHNGTILVRLPERSLRGTSVPAPWQRIVVAAQPVALASNDSISHADGFFGFMSGVSSAKGIGVIVGVDEATAMGPANQALARALTVVVIGILAAFGIAWLIAHGAIERPLQSLLDAARRWSNGDYTARSKLRRSPVEISRLASAFDAMASSLQMREADRVINEQVLRSSRDAALLANRSKTQFLAAASHDLRQPLHALSMAVAVMQARHRDDADTLHIERIGRSVRSLSNLLNTLLDVSQLDAGLIQATPATVSLAVLFEEINEEFAGVAMQKGVCIEVTPSTLAVHSGSQLLGSMIKNLVSNAIKYTPAGGHVQLHAYDNGQRVVIVVADTGIGIDASKQEAVFSDFVQLDNPGRDRNKGLGLGLAIVRRMSQLLEHPVRLQSLPGTGSVFTVSVPYPTTAASDATTPRVNMHYTGSILLVEDDPLVAEVTAILLRQWGAQVTSVCSGEAAVVLLQDAGVPFDAIITDHRLPNMPGTDVIKVALAHRPGLRVIVVSGDAMADMRREVEALGATLLQKPVLPEELASALQA
ncbi:MAG: signal transduction histidine kinase [Bradyrhizobium sp.]|jgi:signal transduction histidine kinase